MSKNNSKIHFVWSNSVDVMFPNEEENKTMYKEFLEMNNMTEDDIDINEYLDNEIGQYWNDEYENLTSHEKVQGEKYYLVLADLGLWNGRADGAINRPRIPLRVYCRLQGAWRHPLA